MIDYCVYGGGNIGHALVAKISNWFPVNVLTRRPEQWSNHVIGKVQGRDSTKALGMVNATNNPVVLKDAKWIFVALPQTMVSEAIDIIVKFATAGTIVCLVPAPARTVDYVRLLQNNSLEVIAFQRVPNIGRIESYGHVVNITKDRLVHSVMTTKGVEPNKVCDMIKQFFCVDFDCNKSNSVGFDGHVRFLSSFLTFSFSNSNPLLHPSRLVELLRNSNFGIYNHCPLFYADWTNKSSEYYIAADNEMRRVLDAIGDEGAINDYESVLNHYESSDAISLTNKIKSIEMFKNICAPWKQRDDGNWEPDYESRYFMEDVPFGTKVIWEYAHKVNIQTPTIDMFVNTLLFNDERKW